MEVGLLMVLMSSGPERHEENCMLMINGKWQGESPVTIYNVKQQKPLEPEKKAAAETRPIETAALDVKPEKNRPKKRPVHGVETRHRTRD